MSRISWVVVCGQQRELISLLLFLQGIFSVQEMTLCDPTHGKSSKQTIKYRFSSWHLMGSSGNGVTLGLPRLQEVMGYYY